MIDISRSRTMLLLSAVVLLTTGMAGCLGSQEESDLQWSSYEDARDAQGPVFEPAGDGTVRVKWLMPNTPDDVPQAQSSIFLLVFDSGSDEPITDANVTLASRMPAMGHGTAAETDPTHVAYGVYQGVINPTMGGQWILGLEVNLASGATHSFEIGYNVEGSGGMDGGMDGGMHGGNGSMGMPTTQYGSYDEAKNADGRVYQADNASGPTRLKLLEPTDPADVPQENGNVSLLLFDQDADEPITDANLTLDAMMVAMGHGTSPEMDPMHAMHGVYKGSTTYSMEGKWRLDVGVTLSDGTELAFKLPVDVGNVSETWGSANVPAFEPYNRTFEGQVQSADYNESHTFDVKGANATVTVTATLSNATMVTDELNLTLLDPEGNALGSLVLTSDSTEGTLTIDAAPAEGTHALRVTGRALQASYEITAAVAPPAP